MLLKPSINDCLLWQDNRPTAVFKSCPEDFIVKEVLDWDFAGHGEHLYLYIEKTNSNTAWVAKQLARFYGVPPRDVGYSGLKDRHAVTSQYFSLRLPGVKPDDYALPEHAEYRVLNHVLHDKKLKRGNHKYNDFIIRLREVTGHKALIEQRLNFIRDEGCPNLFDSQRFGHNNLNLVRFSQWVAGELELRKRDEKSRVLSALRASFFNRQLGERVNNHTWQQVVTGDTVMLDGSNSHFVADVVDETLRRRVAEKDLHPAGILLGADSDVAENSGRLNLLMRRERLQQGYRPLRLKVVGLAWQYTGEGDLILKMRLPAGAYASGVVRQVFAIFPESEKL